MTDDYPPSSQPQQKGLIDRIGQFLTGEPQDQDDLLEMLKDAQEKHLLDAEALTMIKGILQFSKMRVRDIMIPRIQMHAIPKDVELKKIFPLILELGHSRFPVIEDDRSQVVGILLAKDLLAHALGDISIKVEDVMRPVSVVPESKRLNVLLNEFRTERNHMAIVVDEYGMTAGLVTIEDVLEQIVGEIEDEHDGEEEEYVQQSSDNRFTIKALMPIDEFNTYFSSKLSDNEHETLGGYVIHKLGYMPKKGDKLENGGFRFEVLHADDRRVYLLKVRKIKLKSKSAKE